MKAVGSYRGRKKTGRVGGAIGRTAVVPAGLFFFVFSRAAPAAYGGSQARGRIEATAAGLHHNHSNTGSEPCL